MLRSMSLTVKVGSNDRNRSVSTARLRRSRFMVTGFACPDAFIDAFFRSGRAGRAVRLTGRDFRVAIGSPCGVRDLDLNLHHIFEEGVSVDAVNDAVATNDLRVWMVSGGWCDFFHGLPLSDVTDRSVVRQVDITQRLGATGLRLFFGRLNRDA